MSILDALSDASTSATQTANEVGPNIANALKFLPKPAESYHWTFSLQPMYSASIGQRAQGQEQSAFQNAVSEIKSQLIRLASQQVSVNSIEPETEEFSNAIYNSPFVTGLSNNEATLSLVEGQYYRVFAFLNSWMKQMVNNTDSYTFPNGMTTENIRGTVNPPLYYYMLGRLDLLDFRSGLSSVVPRVTIRMNEVIPTTVPEVEYSYPDSDKVVYNVNLSFKRFEINDTLKEGPEGGLPF